MGGEQRSLLQSESELKQLFELSHDLFASIDFSGYFKWVNPAFERMSGYSTEELLRRPVLEFVHPDDVESVTATMAGLLGGHDILGFENRLVCADGSARWIEWNARGVPDEELMVGVGRDVTDRRQADAERRVLAEQQAALRRVATLVAQGVAADEIFMGVTAEVAELFDVPLVALVRYRPNRTATAVASTRDFSRYAGRTWSLPPDDSSVLARVLSTGGPARVDDYAELATPGSPTETAKELGLGSSVGVPILVEGRAWGAVVVGVQKDRPPLPANTVDRLLDFVDLVATAISNVESQTEVTRLAEEQAALRRVATLVAEGASPNEVFAAVADEVSRVIGVPLAEMTRYDADGMATVLASSGTLYPVGSRWPIEAPSVTAAVYETGRATRIDDYSQARGMIADVAREAGFRWAVGVPIIVEGQLWGVMSTGSSDPEPMPGQTEARLAKFTDLVATAIANSQARDDLRRLADEQAALRRVATLVAKGAPAEELFSAVGEEISNVLDVPTHALERYDPDGWLTVVAEWGGESLFSAGTRWPLDGESLAATVYATGRPARIDDYSELQGTIAAAVRAEGFVCLVGVPVVVEGEVWGLLSVGSRHGSLRRDTESRLARFTELVATAIANAESQAQVRRLADEQAALRRVATLVAQESSPPEVFAAVAEEVARLVSVDSARMFRYEADSTATAIAGWSQIPLAIQVGDRVTLEGESVAAKVLRTQRPARMDSYAGVAGSVAALQREAGIRSAAGCPIVVDGQLWGAIIASSARLDPLPTGAEFRMAEFTELVATAISNAQARAELTASRARVVAAGDETRRRIERDLHDGIQQRLVSLALELRGAEAVLPDELVDVHAQMTRTGNGLNAALNELRELSRGIHPASLSEGGLEPALKTLARRSAVPVKLDVRAGRRLPEQVEVAAYYVASEALTNAAKHAHASVVEMCVDCGDSTLALSIDDDGIGGADPTRGSGLIGLTDRVEALGGTISVVSPTGDGTSLRVELPVA